MSISDLKRVPGRVLRRDFACGAGVTALVTLALAAGARTPVTPTARAAQGPGSWPTATYPLSASTDGRYLVDRMGKPFLMVGDSPQALVVNVSDSDTEMYFADRQALGFNAVWVNLLCATYTGGREDGSLLDGTPPFTARLPGQAAYDLMQPNEAYFARVDRMLDAAARHGLLVILDPIETGSWLQVLVANGEGRSRAYGRFLGSRYRDRDNIVWMSGNDFQDWRSVASDAVVLAAARGINETDDRHLHTLELDYLVSSSLDDDRWQDLVGLNATYTYFPTYAQLLKDYARPNFLPSFMVEANYEFEHDYTGNRTLRRQEYWTMLSGSTGQLYGNAFTWPMVTGWQDNLDTPGALQLGHLRALFEPRAWQELVPDIAHTLVADGFGSFADSGSVNDSDYVTAARTADGRLAMAYLPEGGDVTVDLGAMTAETTARWFDPASGYLYEADGSPFANSGVVEFLPPGSNSDGDPDWVLVLETDPLPAPEPPRQPGFQQGAYGVPQSPQSTVSATFERPQTAGAANLVAVGWNDTDASLQAVEDSAGNEYRVAAATAHGDGLSQAIYYAPSIAGGANTVTARFDRPAVYVDLRMAEYRGLGEAPSVGASSFRAGDGALARSGPITTSLENEMLFAAAMTSAVFQSAGGGFTTRIVTQPDGDLVADRLAEVPGSYEATATGASGRWLMQLVALRPGPETPAPHQVSLFVPIARNN